MQEEFGYNTESIYKKGERTPQRTQPTVSASKREKEFLYNGRIDQFQCRKVKGRHKMTNIMSAQRGGETRLSRDFLYLNLFSVFSVINFLQYSEALEDFIS